MDATTTERVAETPARVSGLTVEKIGKAYAKRPVVKGVSLTLQRGEVAGPSNNRVNMIRIASIGESFAAAEIPVQDMAPFRLKEMIKMLDKDI